MSQNGHSHETAMTITPETLRSFPYRLFWSEVVELDLFDHRVGAVNVIEGAIMDVQEDCVELTTDEETPTVGQLVAWAGLVRPDLGSDLRVIAAPAMIEAIDYYEEEKAQRSG